MKHVVFVLLAALVSGCASIPDSIQVEKSVQLVSYQQVAMAPEQQQGKMARWGGVIADVKNQAEQTLLEIVSYPLISYGKPTTRGDSHGRFRVYVDGFLDPVVYEKGRTMTFTGTVSGIELGQVGDHVYHYPTLNATGYYLWKDTQHVDVSGVIWGGTYWDPMWGYYGWNTWPRYRRPHYYRGSIRINGSNESSGSPATPSSSGKQDTYRHETAEKGLKKQR
ncbi:Slp family lipoprotein [Aestuariibacter salexigens]|uniref:Slp family lipoprotein n=1 Tax=Aestuariibacter salexigens TaxID=226010 RepID=UPI0003FAFF6C|nr:Slp family lipoprotein [Aestuariibacter salexigens]